MTINIPLIIGIIIITFSIISETFDWFSIYFNIPIFISGIPFLFLAIVYGSEGEVI